MTIFKNTRTITTTKKGGKFSSDVINRLKISLSNDSNIINSTSYNFDNYLADIKLKDIRYVARYDDIAWYFRKSYTDTTELNYYVKDIKRKERLDSFLIYYQNNNKTDLMTIDTWHYFNITFISAIDTVKYYSNLFDKRFWGLPFIDQEKCEIDSSFNLISCTFNLEINRCLTDILDRKSEAKEQFEIDKFLNYYIAWYVYKAYHHEFYKKNK